MNTIGIVGSAAASYAVAQLSITLSCGEVINRECYCSYVVDNGRVSASSIQFKDAKAFGLLRGMIRSLEPASMLVDSIDVDMFK